MVQVLSRPETTSMAATETPLPPSATGATLTASDTSTKNVETERWRAAVTKFAVPHTGRATWQLLNTVGSYLATWWLISMAVETSWWLAVPLAVLGGGLLVRTFILFHDCGHGSFFASRWANDFWGFVTGVLTFTPFYHWRGEHAVHHGSAGDLDRRGRGDIWTLTVREYLESSRWRRFAYRLSRNPVVLFGIAPLVLFVFFQRIPPRGAGPRERTSVWRMNFAVAAMVAGMVLWLGFWPYVILQSIIWVVGGGCGVYLFYLQHQFEDAYWERGDEWNFAAAALQGSSFFRLPRVLQWFSGNIGFHHIHHLSPRIPNYNLERCHRSDPLFAQVKPMTMWEGVRSLGLKLWDESSRKLVGFRELRRQQKQQKRLDKQQQSTDSRRS
ncbi:MAG: fatty acid desaturase [Planctomycetota bacterium]